MKIRLLTILMCIFMLVQQAVTAQNLKVKSSGYDAAVCTFVMPDLSFDTRQANGQTFSVVSFPGATPSTQLGTPNLPIYSEYIEIPAGASVQVEVTDVRTETTPQGTCEYPLMPVQPAPSKADREALPFVMDSTIYSTNKFYSQELAWIEPLGVARDRNLALLRISPVAYNPVTGELAKTLSMTIKLTYKNADVAATHRLHRLYHTPDFSIGHQVLATVPGEKAVRRDAPIHYLIVSHSSFRGQLDSLINWKKSQGFIVTVAYTDDDNVGTTNTDIANYIKCFYTNATEELPAPTYLLLVGDHNQIPAFNARCSSPATDHVTDLYFASWTDGDHLPDCYYGRFSARNSAELQPQIDKTILYERYDFPDDRYLGKAALIAGEDAGRVGDNAYTYADPAMDYIASTYINTAHNFSSIYYYKNNVSFAPVGVYVTGNSQTSASASALRQIYNNGCGWLNYSAHGYDDSWSTPSFSATNAGSMTNNNMPSVMIGNCCLSGKFNTTSYDACLGEAVLRKGSNAGAVTYIGATNSTYWPHDFCWAVGVRSNFSNTMNTTYNPYNLGMYDRLFHTHNEPFSAWHNTAGSMITAGNTAVQSYGSYTHYYWEIYELFGDPSLIPWAGPASEMTVNAQSLISYGTESYSVTVPEYAYVALVNPVTLDLISAAYADGSGSAVLTLPTDLEVGEYQLSVWAQNYKPYFQTVEVVVTDGCFVVVSSCVPSSGKIIPGQATTFDVVLKNIGNTDATYGHVTLSPVSEGIVIAQPDLPFGNIASGDSLVLSDVWLSYVPDSYKDKSSVQLTALVDFGEGTSTKRIRLFAASPILELVSYEVDSALHTGSSNVITCQLRNNGSAPTQSLTFLLPNLYGFMADQPAAQTIGVIQPGREAQCSFNINMSSSLPNTLLSFALLATDGVDTFLVGNLSFRHGGSDIEDFETGTLSKFNWQLSSNAWEITNVNPYNGQFSARSAQNLPNSRESRISITWTSSVDDSISFAYKVSSENNYDKLKFFVDGNEFLSASGERDWARVSYPVTAGTHIFSFSYSKDRYTASGSDCAWIDDIYLPYAGTPIDYYVDTICQNEPYTVFGQEVSTDEVGSFYFCDTTSVPYTYLALEVVNAPQLQIRTIGHRVVGGCLLLEARGAWHYEWSTGDSTACIVVCPEEGSQYSVTGCRNGCCSTQDITITGLDIHSAQAYDRVKLFPNPADDRVTIQAERINSLRLINLVGQTVYSAKPNAQSATISLQNLPKGVYFVNIDTDGTICTRKLIVK